MRGSSPTAAGMVSQGIGGHEGWSGTPFWKIQAQAAQQRELLLQESLAYVSERKPIVPPNVLVEAACVGGSAGEGAPADSAGSKPFCRHVLIKCLRRVSDRMRVELPTTGLFASQAPLGLFALFDGQSCAGQPGAGAAEFCSRNFHTKVLDNLANLPADCTSDRFVKAALVQSFEDLDSDLLAAHPEAKEGCGASVALLLGDYLFTAVLGACDAMLCEVPEGSNTPRPVPLGSNQGRCHLPEERARLQRVGATVVGEGSSARVQCSVGTSSVTRSLGDPTWKRQDKSVLSCIPEIQSAKLSWAERHLFLLLTSRPVLEALRPQEMVDAALGFPAQPRAACGEITTKAVEKHVASAQCTAVEIWFMPGGPRARPAADEEAAGGVGGSSASAALGNEAPAKKKAKVITSTAQGEMKSARLRHIVVRFQELQRPLAEPGAKKVARSRQEAEALLRGVMRELRDELEELRRKPNQPKKPEELALRSEKFAKLCKEHSECPTSQKGGGMCGDLGWVSRDSQRKRGGGFHDAVSVLRPGDWSDIVASNEGLHLIQRIA